jgi:MSHA biogenesis protein MshP
MKRPLAFRSARGFTLVLAIFLLVSLAGIAAFLLTVSSLQQESVVADEQGARAYQAARAGAEWAAYQIMQNSAGAFAVACNGAASCTAGTTGSATQTLTLAGGLNGFTSSVQCSGSGHTEGSATVCVYAITSTGCNQGSCPGTAGTTYVERQIRLTLTN